MGDAAGPWGRVEALGVTREEAARLGRAMRDPEFRDLLMEHARELQEPATRARRWPELERERGVDVTFLHISPGYVLKGFIRDSDQHSSSSSPAVEVAGNSSRGTQHQKSASDPPSAEHSPARPGGVTWRLPHAVLPPARRDVDGRGAPCAVHDVAFHRDAAALATGPDPRLRALLDDTAATAVEDALGVRFVSRHDRGGAAARTGAVRRIKATYKGTPPLRSPVLRKPRAGAGEAAAAAETDGGFPFPPGLEMPYPYSGATTTNTTNTVLGTGTTKIHGNRNRRRDGGGGAGGGVPDSSSCASESPAVTEGQPAAKDSGKAAGGLQYTVTRRTYSDMQDFAVDAAPRSAAAPHELVVRIDLAGACARCLAQPGAAMRLEVGHTAMELTLSHAKHPRQQEHEPCAHLIVPLPLPVVAGGGHAKLNRDANTLTVTVETLARKNALSAGRRERSGAPLVREVGQVDAQGSQADGQQPDTQADEQQPDTQADGQQPDTQADGQQPDTQADGQQPDTQADAQQPDTQADRQQPDTQSDRQQPDTQADEQQPDTQSDREQPDTQADRQQPDTQSDGQQPDTQADGQQPDTQSDREQPDTQADRQQPDTQSDGQQPDTQADEQQPDTQADELQPDTQTGNNRTLKQTNNNRTLWQTNNNRTLKQTGNNRTLWQTDNNRTLKQTNNNRTLKQTDNNRTLKQTDNNRTLKQTNNNRTLKQTNNNRTLKQTDNNPTLKQNNEILNQINWPLHQTNNNWTLNHVSNQRNKRTLNQNKQIPSQMSNHQTLNQMNNNQTQSQNTQTLKKN
ncbi:protein kintoun [Lampetra planeri]